MIKKLVIGLKLGIGLLFILLVFFAWSLRTLEGQNLSQDERTITFANHIWRVKSGCPRGPGNNCWSDDPASVWVEGGQLHLKLRRINGVWHSAEVYSALCSRYGEHRYFVDGRIDQLNEHVVFALFLYADDVHEVDIEFTRWGDASVLTNAQYAIQPADAPRREPFIMNLNVNFSTHTIDWQTDSVRFESLHGHRTEATNPAHRIHTWTYTGPGIPAQEKCLRMHINLWLNNNLPPSDGQEVEVVIKQAHLPPPRRVYLPLIRNDRPTITMTATANSATGTVSPKGYCTGDYKLALYALTDIWYLQPDVATTNIIINPDCTWESRVNPWDALAAHLVRTDFQAPLTVGPPVPACPPLTVQVIATACIFK